GRKCWSTTDRRSRSSRKWPRSLMRKSSRCSTRLPRSKANPLLSVIAKRRAAGLKSGGTSLSGPDSLDRQPATITAQLIDPHDRERFRQPVSGTLRPLDYAHAVGRIHIYLLHEPLYP